MCSPNSQGLDGQARRSSSGGQRMLKSCMRAPRTASKGPRSGRERIATSPGC